MESNDLLAKIMALVEEKVVKKPRKTRVYTEEQKQVLRDRVKTAREAKKHKRDLKEMPKDVPKAVELVKELPVKESPKYTIEDIELPSCYDAFGECEF